MESSLKRRNVQRARRSLRVRKSVRGNQTRPRLSVFKSNKHLSVQIIDDETGATIVSASTMQNIGISGKTKETAKKMGAYIADQAKKKSITSVVFDRSGFLYHGRIKALADSARENGLKF